MIKQLDRSSHGPHLTHLRRDATASAAPVADFGYGGSPAVERMSSAVIASDATRAQHIETGRVPSGAAGPARHPAEDFSTSGGGLPPLTILGIALWVLGGAAIVLPALAGG